MSFATALMLLTLSQGYGPSRASANVHVIDPVIIVAPDGGKPLMTLVDSSGQEVALTGAGDLVVQLNAASVNSLTDNCVLGEVATNITIPDQTVDGVATSVPLWPDAGDPTDTTGLLGVFVQNTSTAPKRLRCSYNNFLAPSIATCSNGTDITTQAAALLELRFPDKVSCICCSTAGTTTTGCNATSSVRTCR